MVEGILLNSSLGVAGRDIAYKWFVFVLVRVNKVFLRMLRKTLA